MQTDLRTTKPSFTSFLGECGEIAKTGYLNLTHQ
jgi:hypothetical protein